MVLKKMLKYCEKNKRIVVEYSGGGKYLSSGDVCIYVGDVAPTWHSDDFVTYMELGAEKLEDFELIDEEPSKQTRFDIANMIPVERLDCSINCGGMRLRPFMLPDNRIFFVDLDKAAVFKDTRYNQYRFGSYRLCGALFLALDNFVVGAICAERVNLDALKHFSTKLQRGVVQSCDDGFLNAGGQITITDL